MFKNGNANTYAVNASASSVSVTFTPEDKDEIFGLAYNSSQYPAFMVLGNNVAATAVFPTSATVPVAGTIIPAGGVASFTKTNAHGFVSVICSSADAGKYVYIQVGAGE